MFISILKLECFPVGCVPPAFLIQTPATETPWTETPWTETSWKEHGTRNGDPPEGTVDWVPRQEVTSYRAPPPPWTNTPVKILPCLKLHLRTVKMRRMFHLLGLFSCIWRGMTSVLRFGSIIVCKFLAFPSFLSYPYRMLPDQWRCKLGEFFRLSEIHRNWNVQAGAGWKWVVSMVAVVYQMSLFVLRIENSTLLWRPTKKCYICLLRSATFVFLNSIGMRISTAE